MPAPKFVILPTLSICTVILTNSPSDGTTECDAPPMGTRGEFFLDSTAYKTSTNKKLTQ
jgi:hypothetical protein